MTGENDHVVYEQVCHKKLMGRVVLSAVHLSFEADHQTPQTFPWSSIAKHQVSPASYPKALLKLVLKDGTSKAFQLPSRADLDRIRQDVTMRLQRGNRKRSHATMTAAASSFGELDATAIAVTRSSLLAANPTLRQQHHYLVQETETVEEEDFWNTHRGLLEEEYARISGMTQAGTSSLLQSHLPLQGRVTLGVEEMRQIFILYPAVHKAYEEKVPLELSDEQFWRKYLESEYFHRDRGRLGAASRNHAPTADPSKNNAASHLPTIDEQEARAAAVGTDDLFSRYDQKLRDGLASESTDRKWGTKLAVGQFDLASTFETERGDLLEGPRDNHPTNAADDGKGARVIQKYNRHWAMVLHPDQAVAGSNLVEVARRSVTQVLENDEDAKAGGGTDEEMRRLVGFAMASKEEANHALGTNLADADEYEQLTLKNIEAYYTGQHSNAAEENGEDTRKRHAVFAQSMSSVAATLAAELKQQKKKKEMSLKEDEIFPNPKLGKNLLQALTKKMEQDSKTDADTLEVAKTLPEDFKQRLHASFRRSSELLRHFFGLRKLEAQGKKLARIVKGMETVYREMESMRNDLPQSELGETMRKMFFPVMEQLDWAFKLHREGIGGGGGGGFVTVEEL